MKKPMTTGRQKDVSTQSGFSIIEVLVSIALIAILVGGLTAGLITSLRASTEANSLARANVLLTSFEETLQQLEYRDCSAGDLAAVYTQAFADYESSLPLHRRVVNDSGYVSASIVSVDTAGGCVDGSTDSGKQTLELEITYRDTIRSGSIVKRDPTPPDGPKADFDATLLSSPGDPLGIIVMHASKSTPRATLFEYRWDCGDHGAPGDPANTVIVVATHDDPAARCDYNATAVDVDYDIRLTVLDTEGVTNSVSKTVTIPAATAPRLPPVAVIQTTCGGTSPCPSGAGPLTVQFDGSSSNSLEGSIVSYEWDFGDPLSGSGNTSSSVTGNHSYTRDQVHTVTLTVTDDIGLTGTATYDIDVEVPGPPLPVAVISRSPNPAAKAVGAYPPVSITFDGGGSHDDSGQPVSSYFWEFLDDGTTAGGPNPTKAFHAGTYTVRLTVADSGGTSASTEQTFTVSEFDKPVDFRLTDAEGELADHGRFFFAWTNGPASEGDVVKLEITVQATAGCIAFGTKTRTVNAGAPGTTQAYTWVQTWPFSNVCVGSQYQTRARTVRNPDGPNPEYSPYTPWQAFWVTHS